MTRGEWDVTDYYGTDGLGNIYFQSTRNGAMNRTVTKIDQKGMETTIGKENGTTSLSFSPLMNYFTMSYSSVEMPPIYTLNNSKLKQLRILQDNNEVASRYASAPKREFFTINSDGYQLNAYMVKPSGFLPLQSIPL